MRGSEGQCRGSHEIDFFSSRSFSANWCSSSELKWAPKSKRVYWTAVSCAMRLGKLGEQIVVKSKFAFSKIKYEGFEAAEKDSYYVLRKARGDDANQAYLNILEEEADGLYIQDIMRGGVANDDPRIPRNLSE